jgi:triacylglycerol lipase
VRPDPSPHLGRDVWTPALNRFGWSAYLGVEPGSAGVDPAAAPARIEDPAGLPPTFISVGALDLFLEEDVDYARRLARAGVPVELHVFPRTPHGFAGLLGTSPLADEHALVLLAALRRELGGGDRD